MTERRLPPALEARKDKFHQSVHEYAILDWLYGRDGDCLNCSKTGVVWPNNPFGAGGHRRGEERPCPVCGGVGKLIEPDIVERVLDTMNELVESGNTPRTAFEHALRAELGEEA